MTKRVLSALSALLLLPLGCGADGRKVTSASTVAAILQAIND